MQGGAKKGVVPRIQQECPNAKGHHCCAHNMHLSAKKVISENPILRDVLGFAQTLLKLLKFSPFLIESGQKRIGRC